MNKNRVIYLVLGLLFSASIILVILRPSDKPFSSYSSKPDGTKAAYLLLDKLGFRVFRKTNREWSGEGVLLALGSQYVDVNSRSLVFDNDQKFTNQHIRENAFEFVVMMWPYRDQAIYFEEYRRAPFPVNSVGVEASLATISPLWLQILFWNCISGVIFIMFFYRQRLGEPQLAPEFAGRMPLEGVYAMAGALQKARLYTDSVRFYYRCQTSNGSHWDDIGFAEKTMVKSESEALELMAEMDEKIMEYKYGSK
ncbi:MAG: hypothetical protein FWG10_01700 [Eubacteriaceae bacterium]|nr:hypothetical protein [Eubacteriaceae bacterium]